MKAHILLFKWIPIASIFVYKKGLFKANGPFKCLSPRMYLYDHLHEVLYAQRGCEPACVCDDVDHGLEDADGLVHHALGVRAVVRVGQLVPAEVALQQQVHLLVGAAGHKMKVI